MLFNSLVETSHQVAAAIKEKLKSLALRFARVVRYRDDKKPDEAETMDTVRRLAAPHS